MGPNREHKTSERLSLSRRISSQEKGNSACNLSFLDCSRLNFGDILMCCGSFEKCSRLGVIHASLLKTFFCLRCSCWLAAVRETFPARHAAS